MQMMVPVCVILHKKVFPQCHYYYYVYYTKSTYINKKVDTVLILIPIEFNCFSMQCFIYVYYKKVNVPITV